MIDKIPERIRNKIDFTENCWIWKKKVSKAGYGRYSVRRKNLPTKDYTVHRIIYELLVGPVPQGLELDHLCRNRRCCNPAHLEAVTHKVNNNRGMGPSGINSRKTHCKNGHAFTEENTCYLMNPKQKRRCRICWRSYMSKYYKEILKDKRKKA
jgi:hypothetical protein